MQQGAVDYTQPFESVVVVTTAIFNTANGDAVAMLLLKQLLPALGAS